jgi:hypothetical protein
MKLKVMGLRLMNMNVRGGVFRMRFRMRGVSLTMLEKEWCMCNDFDLT